MKIIIPPRLAIILLATLAFTACKKTEFPRSAPIANAGRDSVIILPVNSFLLDGSASNGKENTITHYFWQLTSGPSPVNIINPNSAKTEVENLIKGIYYFELSVLNKAGWESKANVKVTVWDPRHFNNKSVSDTTIQLPYNRAFLKPDYYNIYDNISTWKKISGPGSFNISYLNSSNTPISNLVEGVYQFELSVTYYCNQLTDKDTMTVTVLPDNQVYTAEKKFENLVWIDKYPISNITINNISSFFTVGQNLKGYLKRDINADWEIVSPQLNDPYQLYNYYYTIDNNVLKVFHNYDPTGQGDTDFGKNHSNPAIKIVY